MDAAWTAVLARLRARLLVLPGRLAPLCHEETTIARVRDQLRARLKFGAKAIDRRGLYKNPGVALI